MAEENVVLLAVEVKDGKMQVRINSGNEAWLALALRKAGQAVDYYLAERDLREAEKSLVQVPAGVLDKLRG